MKLFLLRIIIIVSVLFTTGASVHAATSTFKGMNPFMWSLTDAGIADMKQLGVTWVRLDFNWNEIQPNSANDFQVAQYDAIVQKLSAAGINVLGVVIRVPGWANGNSTSDDINATDSNAYGAYAGKLAQHFGPMGVHAWEIFNEQNGGDIPGGANATTYTALLKAAYLAIHQNDSSATVMIGGMAPSDGTVANGPSAPDFLTGIYNSGGQGYFDAVAYHPYGSFWTQMAEDPINLLGIMASRGDGSKKIWGTEVGDPTQGNDGGTVSEQAQADSVTWDYTNIINKPWAGPLFWYDYKDGCTGGNTASRECFFGLLRPDGSKKPAWNTYQAAPAGSFVDSNTPQTGPCTQAYSNTVAIPTGYGAAYNLFSTGKELTVQADCTPTTPVLNAGSGAATQYIYKLGYAYKGGAWQPINLTGSGALTSSNWYAGSAQGSLPFTATDLSSNWNYIVAYVCNWTGTAWKCGCADAACATGNWQLQAIKR